MSFESLPFVHKFPKGRTTAWHPERTGCFETDCATGRAYFRALQELILSTGNPLYLSRVLHAQVEEGTWDGVEIGFAQALGEQIG